MSNTRNTKSFNFQIQKIWKKNWFNENKIFLCNQFSVFVYNFWTIIINWLFTKNSNNNPKMISSFEWRNLRRRLKRLKTGFTRFDNSSRNGNLGNLKREHRLTNHGKQAFEEFCDVTMMGFFCFFFRYFLGVAMETAE